MYALCKYQINLTHSQHTELPVSFCKVSFLQNFEKLTDLQNMLTLRYFTVLFSLEIYTSYIKYSAMRRILQLMDQTNCDRQTTHIKHDVFAEYENRVLRLSTSVTTPNK